MFSIPYLNNREIGVRGKSGIKNSDLSLNVDHFLSRLVCLKKDIYVVGGEDADAPPLACKFRKDSRCDLLAVANEDGDITLFDTSNIASEPVVKSFAAHNNSISDVCWLPDKCQLIAGSCDFSASLWDMNQFKLISLFKKHTKSIKSVDVCHEQSAIFATGSRDGSINVWDTRDASSVQFGKPSVHISHAHCRRSTTVHYKKHAPKETTVSSVTAVAFQDSINIASAGVVDGVAKIWDLRKTYVSNPKFLPLPKHQLDYTASRNSGFGCTNIVFDSMYKMLYVCTTGNKIFKFNCHSYSKDDAVYEGYQCSTYYVKLALSKDDQYLICGSSDNCAYIWKTTKPGLPMLQLHGHTEEVSAVTWSPYDVTKLVTCGDDSIVAVWKIANTEGIEKETIHAKAETYCESSKNGCPFYHSTDQNSTITSNQSVRKELAEAVQTPSRHVTKTITNFFSPVTSVPTVLQISPESVSHNYNVQDTIKNSECALYNTQETASSSFSKVLTQYNHTPVKNLSPTKTPCGGSKSETSNSAFSVIDKENSESDVSPESMSKANSLGQIKRKFASKDSIWNTKRSSTNSCSKKYSKKDVKLKSETPRKTILNYFPVITSPED